MKIIIRYIALLLVFIFCWSTAPEIAIANTKKAEEDLSITTHHTISTQDPIAQELFDHGLHCFYAFDLEKANHFFQKATEQQSTMAMAYWGLALSSNSDVNQSVELARINAPYKFIEKAKKLAKASHTNSRDIAYIDALYQRYSLDPKADQKQLLHNYIDALKSLAQKYPNDPDAQTLYAEGLMDLQDWELWSRDKKPIGKTAEIIQVLQAVLQKHPNHLGANHYYIHAMEASEHPEVIVTNAQRLKSQATTSKHLQQVVNGILENGNVEYGSQNWS